MNGNELTIPYLVRGMAVSRPDHPAIITETETVSYAELGRRSFQMARALIDAGAGKSSRISLLSPDGPLFLTTMLAATRIGALVSLVSTMVRPPELAHILRNSDCQFFIGARRFLRHEYAEMLQQALPGLSETRAGVLRLTAAPFLRSVWLDDAEGLAWAKPVDELISGAPSTQTGDDLLAAIEAEVVPSDDAVIIYTSGSTAFPKAVIHRQSTLIRKSSVLADYFRLEPSDRMMPLLPAFWVGGLAMAFMILGKGATLVYPASPAMDVVMATLQKFGVNKVNSWGPQHGRVVKAAITAGIDVENIWGLGPMRNKRGEPIPPERVPNMLGMSESLSPHSGLPFDMALPEGKPWSCGLPIDGTERRIVDPETGMAVEPGQVGELQIRGPTVMSGFYKMDRSAVFTPDGFYPTSDLVREDEDGYLFFVARRGDMLKSNGANVSRLEVEAALNDQPGVEMSVVVGLKDEEIGQRITAAVVPVPGAELSEIALKEALAKRLSSFKVPKDIIFITADEVEWTGKEAAAGAKVKRNAMEGLIAARAGQKHPS